MGRVGGLCNAWGAGAGACEVGAVLRELSCHPHYHNRSSFVRKHSCHPSYPSPPPPPLPPPAAPRPARRPPRPSRTPLSLMRPRYLSNVLWALAVTDTYDGRFLNKAAGALLARVRAGSTFQFPPQTVGMVAWSYARRVEEGKCIVRTDNV